MVGPVSGAHLNPVLSLVDAAFGGLSWRDAAAYVPTQIAGCVSGAVLANLMFGRGAFSVSDKHRASASSTSFANPAPRRATLEMTGPCPTLSHE